MPCAWDERKNQVNKRRHRLSFEVAQGVFNDPFVFTTEDYRDDNGEMRYQTLGLVEGRLLMVAHVYREDNGIEVPWIITARKAVEYEQTVYWDQRG